MNGFLYGAKRAVNEIISGVITSLIINAFVISGFLTQDFIFLFGLLNVIGVTTLIFGMFYWGITYLLGWIFGVWLLLNSGLIGIIDIIIYLGIPIVVLILKIIMWLKESSEGYSYII
jgi:hypothetical protein